MSCNHLLDCLRCGAVFDDMEDRAEKAEAELAKIISANNDLNAELSNTYLIADDLEAELAEVKRDALLIKVASPDCMGCAHQERSGEIIHGLKDQIDLLTKECIEREALELNHLGMIETLRQKLTAAELFEGERI